MAYHVYPAHQGEALLRIMRFLGAHPDEWFRCREVELRAFGDGLGWEAPRGQILRRFSRTIDQLLGDLVSREHIVSMTFERGEWWYRAATARTR